MAEYIEREALRNSVESIDWYNVYKGKLTAGAPNTENALYKASSIYAVIDNAPAADVAPVRHGEWEVVVGSDGKEHMVCTGCRKQQDLTGVFAYCPNCGAKMDGGDNNSDMTRTRTNDGYWRHGDDFCSYGRKKNVD